MTPRLATERLVLRPWSTDDASAARAIYGDPEVARWLVPVMDRVPDEQAMRLVLQQWVVEDARMTDPAGRWAIEFADGSDVVGGAMLLPLPPEDDFEVSWQLRRDRWGMGFATETGRALARWAFEQGIEEVFALARPRNVRATETARRLGMGWVGETEKYHGLRLQVFRLRPGDLILPG
ncbi:MAG TPA: GNAT family N-acetyltransferase [Jatrophihabitans sp.]|jgi:RimJ/RimL family protein N-acetyltransferase|nr:GNAT family N-acetyltransferase [Jatrophihabitans sp.]